MRILALDPGPEKTGWVVYGDFGWAAQRVIVAGVEPNDEVLYGFTEYVESVDRLAIEMIDSYGMPVGKDVFRTLVWIGRFMQAWPRPDEVRLIERRVIKMELCGTPRAKDSNVRQALIDRVGPPGTKRNQGPTYGCSGHIWAALAVAVVATEQEREQIMGNLFARQA